MITHNHFYYSLLRYCDVRREESLIIGVLLIFPAAGEVRFLYPNNLKRLQVAFPDCPIRTIQDYFEGFKNRATTAGDKLLVVNNSIKGIAKFIADNFLAEDASALQFSEPRTGALAHNDLELITRNFYNRYLKTYKSENILEPSTADNIPDYFTISTTFQGPQVPRWSMTAK